MPRSRRRSCCSGGSRSCWALGPVHSIRGDRGRAAEQKATAAEKAAVAARAARQKVAAQLEEVNKALEAQEAEAARVEEEVCAFCVRTARGSLSRAPGAISTGLSHAHACICAPYRTACDKPARFRECEHVRDRDHDCDSLGRRGWKDYKGTRFYDGECALTVKRWFDRTNDDASGCTFIEWDPKKNSKEGALPTGYQSEDLWVMVYREAVQNPDIIYLMSWQVHHQ